MSGEPLNELRPHDRSEHVSKVENTALRPDQCGPPSTLPSAGNCCIAAGWELLYRSPPGPAVHGTCEVEGGLKAEDRAVVEQGFVEELRAWGVSRVHYLLFAGET